MADYTVKRISDMEAIYGGAFRKARAELGVTSFGFQVFDLPPNLDAYPEHDHSDEGQEEVYAVLSGSGEMEIEGERIPLEPETMIRVGAETRRKVFAADEPLRMLVIGATPGKAYEAKQFTELGEPDPMAA